MLELPEGLEVVGDNWFECSGINKLIVSRSVKKLGEYAFSGCHWLKKVEFKSKSCLETIAESCFSRDVFEKIVIPKSVQNIEIEAFRECENLSSLSFEKDSQLKHVGLNAFYGTKLTPEQRKFPNAVEEDKPKPKPKNERKYYDSSS